MPILQSCYVEIFQYSPPPCCIVQHFNYNISLEDYTEIPPLIPFSVYYKNKRPCKSTLEVHK